MTPRQIALRCAEIAENCSGAYATRNAIRAFAATVPDEGVWVPREPTQEQMIAGAEVKQPNGLISLHGAAAIYQAMLAAVPRKGEVSWGIKMKSKCEMRICHLNGGCQFPNNCGEDGFILDHRQKKKLSRSSVGSTGVRRGLINPGDRSDRLEREGSNPSPTTKYARVVKSVDTTDLKSVGESHVGSTPALGTKCKYPDCFCDSDISCEERYDKSKPLKRSGQ